MLVEILENFRSLRQT